MSKLLNAWKLRAEHNQRLREEADRLRNLGDTMRAQQHIMAWFVERGANVTVNLIVSRAEHHCDVFEVEGLFMRMNPDGNLAQLVPTDTPNYFSNTYQDADRPTSLEDIGEWIIFSYESTPEGIIAAKGGK